MASDETLVENLVTGVLLAALLEQQPREVLEAMKQSIAKGPTGSPIVDSVVSPRALKALQLLLDDKD